MNLSQEVIILLEKYEDIPIDERGRDFASREPKHIHKKVTIDDVNFESTPVTKFANHMGFRVRIKGNGIYKEVFVNVLTHDEAIKRAKERLDKGNLEGRAYDK